MIISDSINIKKRNVYVRNYYCYFDLPKFSVVWVFATTNKLAFAYLIVQGLVQVVISYLSCSYSFSPFVTQFFIIFLYLFSVLQSVLVHILQKEKKSLCINFIPTPHTNFPLPF